jgi:putative transposase
MSGSAIGLGQGCVGAGGRVAVVMQTAGYMYGLRPGVQGQRGLLAQWGRCRFLWNEAVHQQKTGRRRTLCALSNLLTGTR